LTELDFKEAQTARLRAIGTLIHHPDTIEEAEASTRLKDAHVAIIDGFKLKISRAVLGAASDLRLIVLTSTAFHMVDLAAARERSIRIANIPGYSTQAVAEHAFALLFAVVRRIPISDQAMRAAPFQVDPCEKTHRAFLGWELRGKTLGVIGLGAIGQRIAALGLGLGMNVVSWNRTPRTMAGVRSLPLDVLLGTSDVVSLNLAVDRQMEQFISDRELALMKPGAVLINTAGGELVNAGALYRALSESRLSGAGLDVIWPSDHSNPLLGLDSVVFSPQSAAWTREACADLSEAVVQTVEAFARGEPINLIA
jgi:phosphoglycerate dehydrogenase-like enzyme